eukprot:1604343-Prymnesium_polylepis.1
MVMRAQGGKESSQQGRGQARAGSGRQRCARTRCAQSELTVRVVRHAPGKRSSEYEIPAFTPARRGRWASGSGAPAGMPTGR